MKTKSVLVVTSCAVLALGGCAFFGGSGGTVSSSDQAAFQKVFMSSYYAERGGTPGGAKGLTPFLPIVSGGSGSKATVPVGQLTNTSFANLAPKTFVNYPEPGETTTFTISTKDAANHVYDITATTTFPSDDLRKTYVEEYYLMDGNPSFPFPPTGNWTINDAIVRKSGAVWVQDQKARVQQILTFTDGTTRTETIVAQYDPTAAPNLRFAPPSGFGGGPYNTNMAVGAPLDFSQVYYPSLTSDANVQFSSVVVYYVTPASNTNYWFWTGNPGEDHSWHPLLHGVLGHRWQAVQQLHGFVRKDGRHSHDDRGELFTNPAEGIRRIPVQHACRVCSASAGDVHARWEQ